VNGATVQGDTGSGEARQRRITADLVRTLGPMTRSGKLAVAGLLAVSLGGAGCYVYQLIHGLAATAMTDYFSWGIYIVNFVFFIGISMAGTLISAMLRLTGTAWRCQITRLAEGITLFALLVAGPMVIIDMGRPDRFFSVFEYGRLQSPIIWDVISLTTYMVGSLLYLYLPLIPDLAILRDTPEPVPPWHRWLYRKLSLGWTGTATQLHLLERAISVMAVIIIPVAISIHTVTAWIFGMTLRPGWHSTIIGPDFVFGALYSGVAAVITAMALFRRCLHLEAYLTADHFRKLGLLLLVLCLVYAYFTVNEYIGSGYATQGGETSLLAQIFRGPYTIQFWSMVSIGLLVPGLLLALPWTRTIRGIVVASILVNIGMWMMRYIIVVPTLASPYLPAPQGVELTYIPTLVEWSISAGGFSVFCLLYLVFAKVFPIISIWEVARAPEAVAHPGLKSALAPVAEGRS
jgi:molybdopterin-containing oxidoreductase family membrane subunit